MIAVTARRLPAAAALRAMPEGNDNDRKATTNGFTDSLRDISVQLIAVGTIALVGTCIRVWSGMDVIQTQINQLVKSDSQQDQELTQVQEQINTLRIQVGIIRAQLGSGPAGMGRP